MNVCVAAVTALTISVSAISAAAQAPVVVTPENEQGFSETILAGGTVTFVEDPNAPAGKGALRLTTDADPQSYAAYFKSTNTLLRDVTQLSYFTKRNSGPEVADASFALAVELTRTSGTSFLIYEPYLQQPPASSGTTGRFAFQDVFRGRIYSNATITCEGGTVQSGAPGNGPFYTITEIQGLCPNALVTDFSTLR